jgi:hypothetical protein
MHRPFLPVHERMRQGDGKHVTASKVKAGNRVKDDRTAARNCGSATSAGTGSPRSRHAACSDRLGC